MAVARTTSHSVCNSIFVFSFLFRTWLIAYADGFIYNGTTNLKLFHQLYWTICISYIMICIGIFPISLILKGDFPMSSTTGQICLLIPLKNSDHYLKLNGIVIALAFVCTFFILYAKSRSYRLLKELCPRSKMSCIRKYRRNVMNYNQNMIVAICWLSFSLLEVVMVYLYSSYNIDPNVILYIDIFIFVIFKELLQLFATCVWGIKDIPSCTDPPRRVKFYVAHQRELIPRHPQVFQNYKHSKVLCQTLDSASWSMDVQAGSVEEFSLDKDRDCVTIPTLNMVTVKEYTTPKREKPPKQLKSRTYELNLKTTLEYDKIEREVSLSPFLDSGECNPGQQSKSVQHNPRDPDQASTLSRKLPPIQS